MNPKLTRQEQTHAIYQSYLYFYTAISYEALGRAAHTYSSKKVTFLQTALDAFSTCGSGLSSLSLPSGLASDDSDSTAAEDESGEVSPAELSFCDSDTPGCSPIDGPESESGPVGEITQIIDDSMAWDIEDDPFVSHEEGRGRFQLAESPSFKELLLPREGSRTLLLPSPLKIQKSIGESDMVVLDLSLDSQFLRTHINSSISAIRSLIDEITQLQRAHRASKTFSRSASYWSFETSPTPRPGGVLETKPQRIARLRNEGWTTVGLRNHRRGWKGAASYQAYCNKVLDELYLDKAS